MNKIVIILALFIISTSLFSCKKDWTCECKTGTTKAFSIKIPKIRKNDAKTICTDYNKVAPDCILK
jgi:hypothetical protein